MSTRSVGLELLSNCRGLLAELARSCKSYTYNDQAEREWAEFAWMEAVAELRIRQSREALQRIAKRER
jgi:hypothetical protein